MRWEFRGGRRARSRRRKARAKDHPIRSWSPRRLALELAAMERFVDEPQDRVLGPDGAFVPLARGQRVVEFAHCGPIPPVYSKDWKPPDVTIERWRVCPLSEGRLFYEGRNRRYRKLTPTLERI